MRADTIITELCDANGGFPAVAVRDRDGAPVLYVLIRTEYGETAAQCIERAGRIAHLMTRRDPRV